MQIILKKQAEIAIKKASIWYNQMSRKFQKRHVRPFLPELGQSSVIGNGLVLARVKNPQGGALKYRFALIGTERVIKENL